MLPLPDGAIPGTGLLSLYKEPGFTLVPNELLDVGAGPLGARGCFLYLVLSRMTTRRHYPSRKDLSRYCKLSSSVLKKLLGLLRYYNFLNEHDIRAIDEADEASNNKLDPVTNTFDFEAPEIIEP
jgi:hypothetical protein